jgi:hypothetical protein
MVIATCTVSCSRPKAQEHEGPPPATLRPPPEPTPPAPTHEDQVRSDELEEGSLTALGVPLPRSAVLDGQFHDLAMVSVPEQPERVLKFLGDRLASDPPEGAGEVTTFRRVRSRKNVDHVLEVRVLKLGYAKTDVTVRDVTPPPPKDLPNDEARWKAAGLDADGRPLNFGQGL